MYRDVVYVGVSSIEESTLAKDASYKCCTFRGSVVALDANTGVILWKMYDVPDNHGATNQYSGGAIWQPPAIDPQRGVLYIGTGNNYTVPASVLECQAQAESANDTRTVCTPTDDYIDTALSLDLRTGLVKWARNTDIGNVEWAHRVLAYDNWTIGCTTTPPNSNCPTPKGPDFDLGGAGPNLLDHLVGFGALQLKMMPAFFRMEPPGSLSSLSRVSTSLSIARLTKVRSRTASKCLSKCVTPWNTCMTRELSTGI